MSFDQAFRRTLSSEGRYSNDPRDPGGETMWGITVATARAHGYRGAMKDMSLAIAKDIYRAGYWDLLHLDGIDKLSPALAAEMFDAAVNCGLAVPVRFLQRALNCLNRQEKDWPDMPVDGVVGPRTLAAARAMLFKRGEKEILAALICQRGVHYLEISERRQALEAFENGWWPRIVGAMRAVTA